MAMTQVTIATMLNSSPGRKQAAGKNTKWKRKFTESTPAPPEPFDLFRRPERCLAIPNTIALGRPGFRFLVPGFGLSGSSSSPPDY